MNLVVVIDGEPVAKGRARNNLNGSRPFTPAKTVRYERKVELAARKVMGLNPPMTCPVSVRVTAYRGIAKSWPKYKKEAALKGLLMPTATPDGDNYAKAALDGLNGVAFLDDAQVCDLITSKRFSPRPRLIIEVEPMGGKTSLKDLKMRRGHH